MSAGLHRALAALVAATLFLVGLVTAGAAQAATQPAWEPDPNSVGTLAFYDASGNVITTGRTDVAPFALYAVGSTDPGPKNTNTQAGLFFANPLPNTPTVNFYREQVGNYSDYPVKTAGTPAAISGLAATTPVTTGTSADQTLDGFESDSVISPTAGYQNVVQVRMRTAKPGGAGTSTYDVADLQINPTTHTWTQIYPATAPATAPGAPTKVMATAGIQSANVTWTAPTVNGGSPITGYQVEASRDNGTTFTQVAKSTDTSTTITGLTAGTAYVFRVEAINAVGTGTPSALSTPVTPTAPALPAAPSNVTAVAGNGAAVVSWFAPVTDGGSAITGYRVGYATSGSDTFTPVVSTGTATRATITGLTNGTSYVFRVSAINAVGTGPASAISTAVTPLGDASALTTTAPASVRYGYTATIGTKLTDAVTRAALAKQSVTLYGRRGKTGAFSVLKTVTTSSTGTASIGVKPSSYEQFYWHYSGTSAHKATSSSAKAVTVSQTVAVKATATKVKAKTLIKVYGTVAPAGSGQRVYLQVYNHGWKTVTSAVIRYQTLPNHKRATGFVLGVKPAKGSKVYRVYKSATSTLVYGVSAQFHLAGR